MGKDQSCAVSTSRGPVIDQYATVMRRVEDNTGDALSRLDRIIDDIDSGSVDYKSASLVIRALTCKTRVLAIAMEAASDMRRAKIIGKLA